MGKSIIEIEHISKYYNLGVINNGSLYRDIQTWFALKRGKDDPNSGMTAKDYEATPDGFWALKDINFKIEQGQRVGIIGRNGAGKSTLLKILSRITAPTEGRVKIKGRIASLLEVGTGFHGELTGRENIYLNGAILGMKKKEIDKKIDEIIAFSEIEHHIDTPVKRYSSGMYVRLAFAVAAHLESEILIADEVLAVGDAAFQKKAIGKMSELSTSEGRTILFVSHQMEAVQRLCSSGIILDKGRLVYQNNNIENVVSQYLNPASLSNSEVIWENKDQYNDNTFKPLKIYMTNSEHEITRDFSRSDSSVNCIIETQVQVPHTLFNMAVAIKRNNNSTVYVTWRNENSGSNPIKQGFNKFIVPIPVNILKNGSYYIDIYAGVYNEKEIIPFQSIVLPFNILGEENHQGDIHPVIQWDTQYQ